MANTVFITGGSTGIGKATVLYFLKKGWNVVATVRKIKDTSTFSESSQLKILILDVTDSSEIRKVAKEAVEAFGQVDVVVNNAGYGLMGPFESAREEQVRREFETNVFGVIDVTKAFLPYFKKQKSGRYITIASMFSHISMPFFSYYAASKHAVEGFTESLWYELEQYNISVKMIEPGTIKTDFFDRSLDVAANAATSDNASYFQRVYKGLKKTEHQAEPAVLAAEVIYKAATDSSWRLRYIVDKNARILISLRSFLPVEIFLRLLKKRV